MKIDTSLKLFMLNRKQDATGVSGTGIVARGIIFPTGKCVMEWQTKHTSIAVYDSLPELMAIHGHDGKTEVLVSDAHGDLEEMKKIGRYRVMEDVYAFGMMGMADRLAAFFDVKLNDKGPKDFGLVAECGSCRAQRTSR